MAEIKSYENLIVWQKSMELVMLVYGLTKEFPNDEIYGLVSQIKRAAVSIPSNIAEGSRRGSKKDFRHFVLNSFASGAELETQLKIADKLNFIKKENYEKASNLLDEIMKMLNKLVSSLNE